MLDLHPALDNRIRVFADLLHKEGITKGYCIKEDDDNGPKRGTRGSRRGHREAEASQARLLSARLGETHSPRHLKRMDTSRISRCYRVVR